MSKKHKEKKHKQKKEKEEKKDIKKELEKEISEYRNKYFHILAESENTRKRLQKEKQETTKFAIENTLCDFLPILDNFENALKFSEKASDEVKSWATGFQMILSQFKDVLHTYGIVSFHSEGNFFDPHHHEAMEIVETHDQPDGMILEEFAKGYKTQNRTLRPAQVKVVKTPREEEVKDDETIKEESSSEQEELQTTEEKK